MNMPGPLQDGVQKISSGIYQFRGVYLRFNRMEINGAKWTAHFRMGESIDDCIAYSNTLRGVIEELHDKYVELATECKVPGYASDESE